MFEVFDAPGPQFQQDPALGAGSKLDFPLTHAAKLHGVPSGFDRARQARSGHHQQIICSSGWRKPYLLPRLLSQCMGNGLCVHNLACCDIQTSGDPFDDPCAHHPKERLVHGCASPYRQKVCT